LKSSSILESLGRRKDFGGSASRDNRERGNAKNDLAAMFAED
jgi:hypothetical protein